MVSNQCISKRKLNISVLEMLTVKSNESVGEVDLKNGFSLKYEFDYFGNWYCWVMFWWLFKNQLLFTEPHFLI